MFISVVMPIYNAEKFLRKSIDSILEQSYSDFELILIDDGSTDNSMNIAMYYEDNDNRVKVFSQSNQGASAARNLGLKNAGGDYLIFIDADDYVESELFADFKKIIESENVDLIISPPFSDYYDSKNKITMSVKRDLVEKRIEGNKEIANEVIYLFENEVINAPYCKLFKLDLIRLHNLLMPTNIHLQEDLFFNVKYLEVVNSAFITNNAYYHYNHFQIESVTSKYYNNKWEMLEEVNNNVISYYTTRAKNMDILESVNYFAIKNAYASFLNLFHKNCLLNKKEKIRFITKVVKSTDFSDKVIASNKKGIKYKTLKFVLNTKNGELVYYFSKILFLLKYKFKLNY